MNLPLSSNQPDPESLPVYLPALPDRPGFESRVSGIIDQFKLSSVRSSIESYLDRQSGSDFLLEASTGAGKSVTLALMAALQGYPSITVYVPTRQSATALAEYVSELLGTPIGGLVGFRAGLETAVDLYTSPSSDYWNSRTRIIYSTYGRGVMPESYPVDFGTERLVILDEIQDPGTEKILTVGAVLRQKDHGAPIRIVPMSATCDLTLVRNFFGISHQVSFNESVYPVECYYTDKSPLSVSMGYLRQGLSGLVFRTGERECQRLAQDIGDACRREHIPVQIEIFTGKTSPAQRHRINSSNSDVPLIIFATDAAQQSLTLKVDFVLNNQQVKRSRTIGGHRALVLEPTTRAEDTQRRGRVGRLEGRRAIYVEFNRGVSQSEFPTPDILRETPLRAYLMLKGHNLDFNHPEARLMAVPGQAAIQQVKKDALRFNLIDASENLTSRGVFLARFPADPYLGVIPLAVSEMTQSLPQPEREKLIADALTLVAVCEQGGFRQQSISAPAASTDSLLGSVPESDLLRSIALLRASEVVSDATLTEHGISPYKVRAISGRLQELSRHFEINPEQGNFPPEVDSRLFEVMQGLTGPLFKIFHRKSGESWSAIDSGGSGQFSLGRDSVIPHSTRFVIGVPVQLGGRSFIEFAHPVGTPPAEAVVTATVTTAEQVRATITRSMMSFESLQKIEQKIADKLPAKEVSAELQGTYGSALREFCGGRSLFVPWGLADTFLSLRAGIHAAGLADDAVTSLVSIPQSASGRSLPDILPDNRIPSVNFTNDYPDLFVSSLYRSTSAAEAALTDLGLNSPGRLKDVHPSTLMRQIPVEQWKTAAKAIAMTATVATARETGQSTLEQLSQALMLDPTNPDILFPFANRTMHLNVARHASRTVYTSSSVVDDVIILKQQAVEALCIYMQQNLRRDEFFSPAGAFNYQIASDSHLAGDPLMLATLARNSLDLLGLHAGQNSMQYERCKIIATWASRMVLDGTFHDSVPTLYRAKRMAGDVWSKLVEQKII